MSNQFDITCAIPRSGRTFENFLRTLHRFDVAQDELTEILAITREQRT
ncbi:MAG: hypothetical protein R2867_12330 [Caldilineaceae bacterium]